MVRSEREALAQGLQRSAARECPQALQAAIAATEEDATYAAAWLTRGTVHHCLHQHAQAVTSLDKALKLGWLNAEQESVARDMWL